MSDDDDELSKLLNELGRTEPLPVTSDDDEVLIIPSTPRQETALNNDLAFQTEELTASEEPAGKELSAVFNDQLRKVASQYGSVFEEIIANYKTDREQAQDVIDKFMDVINLGGKVPRIYLEKIADAVRAKNEIAQTAIRALDSLPKLMAATKGNDIFSQVNMSFNTDDLQKILDSTDEVINEA